MVFFNFETFAGGHALFSKIIYDLFFFFALEHPVSDNSFRGIQTLVLRDRHSKAEKGRNFEQTFSLGLPTSFNEKSFVFLIF